MIAFVTGAAGFVGSHLVDRLLSLGHSVIGYDNFSTGHEEFLFRAREHAQFRLERGDVLDLDRMQSAMTGSDIVFHLAANADVRFGTRHPRKDLEQNTIGTWNVLEAMRRREVRRIAFASTGSVYGEPSVFPTPEDNVFPIQTSLYGASKVAAEALIEAYCEGFDMQSYIFRFVSILGPRYTHGHIIDFYAQLREHPDVLYVLGNGRQRKSYLHVYDCTDAMLCAVHNIGAKVNRFNLGTSEYCEVSQSVRWITESMGLCPTLIYSGGERGWTGDSPFIFLDCARMRSLGWSPRFSIRDAVIGTVRYLESNQHVIPQAARRNAS